MLTASLLMLAMAMGVAACGSEDPEKKADTPTTATAAQPDSTQTTDSTEPPKAVSAKTAEGAVKNLWSRIAAGSFPLTVSLYHPKVRKEVGSKNIIGGLTTQRANFVGDGLKVSNVETTDQGVLVTVKKEIKGKPARENSYLLSKSEEKWVIRYDSILADGLAAYVQMRTQRDIDPKAKRPSVQALAAGRAASQEFTQLFAGT